MFEIQFNKVELGAAKHKTTKTEIGKWKKKKKQQQVQQTAQQHFKFVLTVFDWFELLRVLSFSASSCRFAAAAMAASVRLVVFFFVARSPVPLTDSLAFAASLATFFLPID